MQFKLLSQLTDAQTIVSGNGIRDLARLNRQYGRGNWLKRKGIASILFPTGEVALAEVHWYEANGIGKREMKVKRVLE